MSRLPRNESIEAMTAELDAAGLSYRTEHGGKHGKIIVDRGGKEHIFTVPLTPSDPRSWKNDRANVRRAIREWQAEAGTVAQSAASAVSQPIEEEMVVDSMEGEGRSIETIEVLGRQIAKVEYKGQRVVTLRQIDEAHKKPDDAAYKQYHRHKERYLQGVDFIEISASEFRSQFPSLVKKQAGGSILLFTERGYGKIVKGWNDDLSWQLHDAMQDAYFMVKQAVESAYQETQARVSSADDAILDLIIAGNQDVLAAQSRSAQDLVEHVEGGKAAVLRYLKMYVRETLDGMVSNYTEHRRSLQKHNQALALRMEGVEKSVTELLKKAEQPLLSRAFVFADWYDVDKIYQEFFPDQIIPNRRFLSQAISKSLDAYCKKRQRGFDMQSRRLGGRNVNLWHRDSVKHWVEVSGRDIVRSHLAKSRRADPVVVAFGAKR